MKKVPLKFRDHVAFAKELEIKLTPLPPKRLKKQFEAFQQVVSLAAKYVILNEMERITKDEKKAKKK